MKNELSNRCIERIDPERAMWAEAKKYAGRLKSKVKSLQDLQAALNIANQHMKELNVPPRDARGVRIIARAVKMIHKIADVLIAQAAEDQQLYIDRHDVYSRYRYDCRFKIDASNISLIKGYDLLLKNGLYSEQNSSGVVKDHRVSVKYGYDNGVPAEVIGHIKNCEFMQFKDNLKKSKGCSLTLESLLGEIESH